MTIIVCAPHPDDETIGMGGTILKLSKNKEKVIVVIFTQGQSSHPWQREEAITTTRQREAQRACKVLGVEEVVFLKLKDTQVSKEIVEKNVEKEFSELLQREKPKMIFTTAIDDVHSDHRAVARFVRYCVKKYSPKTTTWQYTVWNPFFILNRDQPRLVIDITKEFKTKWKAIKCYQTQKVSTVQLVPTIILRGLVNGLIHNMTMAEVFLKLT